MLFVFANTYTEVATRSERKTHRETRNTRADLICLPNDIILVEKGQLDQE